MNYHRMMAILLCIGSCIAGMMRPAAAEPQPNIVLVMPDDVGYGDYASLGSPIMRTPSVDAFKQQSLLFTQFHVSPTCSPIKSGKNETSGPATSVIKPDPTKYLTKLPSWNAANIWR